MNAILAGQDIIFLGERGQAKSRIIRSLTSLLDEAYPALAGCEIPENPFDPITTEGRQILAEQGDAAPLVWLDRSQRYGEKLATPDIHHRGPDRPRSTPSRWRKAATSRTS